MADRLPVIATVGIAGPDQARQLLMAIEAGLRAGATGPQLQQWRVQLMNMRWRAYLNGWGWGEEDAAPRGLQVATIKAMKLMFGMPADA